VERRIAQRLVVLGGIAAGATALGFLVPAAVAYEIEETWLAAVLAVVGVYLATLVATRARSRGSSERRPLRRARRPGPSSAAA
jgi:uncharacterized membrane protein YfcA